MPELSDHFKGKSAVDHVVEAQARGIIAASEIHGTEIPGSISAGSDAIRNTCVILVIIHLILSILNLPLSLHLILMSLFLSGWMIWLIGRNAWLGWSRLERLHRILEEERWEIEHNRQQEREELKALYAAKGFEGQLLEDVLDVLMADGDRLLRVMIEEELGLTLEVNEHPLKQALGAGFGVAIAGIISLICLWIWPTGGIYLSSIALVFSSSIVSAGLEGNRWIPAIIWNLGLLGLSGGTVKFLLDFAKAQWGGI